MKNWVYPKDVNRKLAETVMAALAETPRLLIVKTCAVVISNCVADHAVDRPDAREGIEGIDPNPTEEDLRYGH